MKAEVSDIDQSLAITIGGTTIPGLTSRQSETTIRLGDGQSFAIAGLLSDRIRSQIEKVPFLGSIPILGALFRSTQYRREETELLVVVTARLAKPVAPHQLPPLPTERELNHPGDFELFLMGWDGGGKQPRAPELPGRQQVARAARAASCAEEHRDGNRLQSCWRTCPHRTGG